MKLIQLLKGAVVLLLREKLGLEKARLRNLGARVIHAPVVRRVSGALGARAKGDWIAFTSASGAEAFRRQFQGSLPAGSKIASVGPTTARAVQEFFKRRSHFMPSAYTTEALGRELPVKRGESVFLVRSGNADQRLDKILHKRGAKVQRFNPYRLVYRPLSKKVVSMLKAGKITHVFFGSRSQVEAFFVERSQAPFLRKGARHLSFNAMAIGPETAKALRELGVKPIVAKVHTFDGLIELLMELQIQSKRQKLS
ncbi:MAG: uroporphyrinogen-III synthase [Elusimicrobia bacterium]|nr:uroporphyrinogen-III synthase [Elusimicrobiota bacterium]